MKKVFIMAVFAASMFAASAVEISRVEPISASVVTVNAYEVTLVSINKRPVIRKYNVKVEIVNGKVMVNGKYEARSGDGYGYSYVVTIGNILYGFDL